MKKMLSKKLQGVSPTEQDKLLDAVESNPELFQKIAQDVEAEMKGGKDQMSATLSVMKIYEQELRDTMNKNV